jgi:hypothetical protein
MVMVYIYKIMVYCLICWFNIIFHNYYFLLLYKVWCFIEIPSTDKTDNLTCEIIYDNFTCENYRFSVKIIAFQRLSFTKQRERVRYHVQQEK